MNWFNGFEQIVQTDVPLAKYVWYRLGGPARWMCEPRDEGELTALMRCISENGIAWRVLGGGANVLAPDAGFDGAVIRLVGAAFEGVRFENAMIEAGAGADFPRLITASLKHGLVGLEAFAGIPGTVGGIIRQNAGGRYGEIGTFVRTVRALDVGASSIADIEAEQLGFRYRGCSLEGRIVVGAAFELAAGDVAAAKLKYREIFDQKQQSQPTLAARSAGCIFKNPPEAPAAGKLLDDAGLKGVRVGGAEISTVHANFIVAGADAKADDVLQLISLAKERVFETSGVVLTPEVDIW